MHRDHPAETEGSERPTLASDAVMFPAGGKMGSRLRSTDWRDSAVGPADTWPQQQRDTLNLILQSPQPIFLWWGPSYFQFYNDAAMVCVESHDHPDVVGQSAYENPSQIWAYVGQRVEKVADGEAASTVCVPEARLGMLSLSPVLDASGCVQGVIGISGKILDEEALQNCQQQILLLERRVREAHMSGRTQIERERASIKALFDNIPSFFCILSGPNYTFEYVNAAHRSTFNGRDCTGKRMCDAIPESDQEIIPILNRVMQTGESLTIRATPVEQDGVMHYYDVTHAPRRDLSGHVTGLVVLGNDVTDEVITRKELEQLTAELQQAVKVRDDFLCIASHEINTPVTSLKLQTQMMLRTLGRSQSATIDAGRVQKMLKTADVSLGRLGRLIDDILDITRISTDKLVLNIESFDLATLLQDLVERLSLQADAAHTKVVLKQLDPAVGSWDRSRIEQIISNLLVNAMRYGDMSPIDVTLQCTAQRALVTVRDYGPGVPEHNRARIFERFETGSAEKTLKGLGLGLYISRQIAEHHGGKLTLVNDGKRGAAFVLDLPRLPTQ